MKQGTSTGIKMQNLIGIGVFEYYKEVHCSKVVSFGFNEFQRKAIAKVIFGEYKNKAINPFKMA